MNMQLATGNQAAGHSMSIAGEANRHARGSISGIYPITPQTEIVEYVAKFPFSKGRVIPVESEHSAMGVCIGASLNGARAFTASSSNGLAYMAENVMVAAFYRLPIVMAAVNRTLGPPWNIWADQGDSLMFRDFAWVQLYCDSNQDVADTTLLAFRLAEDPRVLLPVMVCMDAFIVSHTSMEIELASQEQADRYLPPCEIPHHLDPAHPVTVGGMAFPQETLTHRMDLDQAIRQVPAVLEEHRAHFNEVFGREVSGAVSAYRTEDADQIFIASGTISLTLKDVVDERRQKGEKIGMIRIKMFRPFPTAEIARLCRNVEKIGVLDRNYSAGTGGIFWQEIRAALQGRGGHLVQGYLTGVGGGDVVPDAVREVVADLKQRTEAGDPVWKGIDQ
ncbi:MAG: pyruvate ferredoxin oxidoreductase [Xanthomonadales bacterium]|nr:pyruvate ferredoxin oxidoreductase [Gammaproteobacteria bacterium]NND58348.1 pyruvate ferredoxin oxidoreductase [Xanthomonadales bacterium]NNK50240.1 pyruvate ferredoxin oxidoreductase [Xanthomonadales bacterium]